MKKIDRIVLYLLAVLLVGYISYNLIGRPKERLVYVDIGKLLENYKFRKELQGAADQNINRIKLVIDSLKMVQKATGNPGIDTPLHKAQYALNQYYEISNKEATQKIWDRLNPVIEQFGKDKHLEMVIGANGAGNVLYGAKDRDVTDELITYVNAQYEKGS